MRLILCEEEMETVVFETLEASQENLDEGNLLTKVY